VHIFYLFGIYFTECVVIKINRLKKYLFNALLLSCVSLIMRTVGVSFNVYVSSKIGSEGMGLLTLTGGIYAFAITFATSGINTAVVRLVSACLDLKIQFIVQTHKTSIKIICYKLCKRCCIFVKKV